MSSPRLVNYSKSKSSKKVSSANKNLFFDQFMEKRSSPTKYSTVSSKRSPAKGVKVARRGKSVRNVDNLTFKNGCHEALSQGGFRASKKAVEELSKLALRDNSKALCVATNARKIASLNGRKTILVRDIEASSLSL